jgi:hypothetical protein
MSGELLARAEAMVPGPELVALLDSLDGSPDPVRVVAQWERVRSWLDAQVLARTATLVDERSDEMDWREAQAYLALALGVGERTAQGRIATARDLVTGLPETVSALESGAISLAKAREIAEQTHELDPADRAVVEQEVLAEAPVLTCATLRRAVRRQVLRIDPDAVARRRARTVADRHVRLSPPDPDGMATLSAFLTHDEALRAFESVRVHAERREMCQADAFVGLLTGEQAPVVTLTLRAGADGPVTIPGVGPLDNATLAGLLGAATKVVLRPIVQPAPESGYRPSTPMRDHVTATQPECRFPQCTRPSRRCDLDHVNPWDTGGTTSVENLIPLCRGHHRLKTFTAWTPELADDLSVTWTDPRGEQHVDPPLD